MSITLIIVKRIKIFSKAFAIYFMCENKNT